MLPYLKLVDSYFETPSSYSSQFFLEYNILDTEIFDNRDCYIEDIDIAENITLIFSFLAKMNHSNSFGTPHIILRGLYPPLLPLPMHLLPQ